MDNDMGMPQATLFGTARQRGGSTARASGKQFEQLILASQFDARGPVCALSQVKNFAKRIPAGSDWERRTGERFRMVEERSPFDFCGSVWERGIGIFLDAKSLEDAASFPVNNASIVKPHQLASLERLERAGAFSGFLVRCGRFQDVRFVWASAALAAANTGKPMQWHDKSWEILGPAEWGRAIPLRKLFEVYE